MPIILDGAAAPEAADPKGTPAVAAIALRMKLRRSIWIGKQHVSRPAVGQTFAFFRWSTCLRVPPLFRAATVRERALSADPSVIRCPPLEFPPGGVQRY